MLDLYNTCSICRRLIGSLLTNRPTFRRLRVT